MTGTEDWSNVTKTVNSTVGATIKWCVYANDTDNEWNGTSCDTPFSYQTTADVTPPTFSNYSTNTTKPGEPTNFTIDVTDDAGLDSTAGYIFSTNNTGTWMNASFVYFTGTGATLTAWNVTVLNSTELILVQWKFYANDTSNNWNVSELYNLTTSESESPTFSNNATDTTGAGNPCNFTLDWDDNVGLSGYIFSTNNTGAWANASWIAFTSSPETAWNVTTLNTTVGILVQWKFYANDTSDNWNTSDTYGLITIDEDNPTFTDNTTNTTIVGEPVMFSVKWSDNAGLSGYIFEFDNCTGTLQEDAWQSFSGQTSPQWSNVTKIINSTVGCTIRWNVTANDTSNNWNSTGIQSFVTITIPAYCDVSIQTIPAGGYQIESNTYYCLVKDFDNLVISSGSGAIEFDDGIQNSVLDCLGYTLDGVGTRGGVLVGGDTDTVNNTVKNCNITDFSTGISIGTGTNNNSYIDISADHNIDYGLFIWFSNNNVFRNISANSHNEAGVLLYTSHNNTFTNMTSNNQIYGFTVEGSKDDGSMDNVFVNITAKNNSFAGIFFEDASGNNSITGGIFTNNTNGVRMFNVDNNIITGGSVSGNGVDYFLDGAYLFGTQNEFRNTNFTSERTIDLEDNAVWFNYNNETTGGVWLRTKLSTDDTTLTRKLTYWNNTLVQWNDSASTTPTAYYNVSGLLSTANYYIFDNSVKVQTLTADANGVLPQFSITLSGEREIKVSAETDPPGVEVQQYANISFYNSTHVNYSLSIWVYNHFGSLQSINVTPDSNWTSWYVINNLPNNQTNTTTFYKMFTRENTDTNVTILAPSINVSGYQPPNSLLIYIPATTACYNNICLFDLKVIDKDNNAIENVNVTVKNSTNDIKFSVLTQSDGTISQQQLNDLENPHLFTITESRYESLNFTTNITKKTEWILYLRLSPAEVRINSIVDNTIPTITADVTITNEGDADREYQYEYCIVSDFLNKCGGADDEAYGYGAKFIKAGESWNTYLTLDLNEIGTYWFKVLVYWGGEKSGASRLFEAEEAPPIIPMPTPSVVSIVGKGELEISEYPDEMVVEQGGVEFYSLLVKNIGTASLHNVNITLWGISQDWYTTLPEEVEKIYAKDEQDFILKIKLPANVWIGDYLVIIKAIADEDSAEVPSKLRVVPIILEPIRISDIQIATLGKLYQNEEGRITLIIENLGTEDVIVTASLILPENIHARNEQVTKLVENKTNTTLEFDIIPRNEGVQNITLIIEYDGKQISKNIILNIEAAKKFLIVLPFSLEFIAILIIAALAIILLIYITRKYFVRKKRKTFEKKMLERLNALQRTVKPRKVRSKRKKKKVLKKLRKKI